LSSLGACRCFLGFDEGVPCFLAIVHSPNYSAAKIRKVNMWRPRDASYHFAFQ
jgi:hypothetical protein